MGGEAGPDGLPRLVAHAVARGAREQLLGVARQGGVAHLALLSPPRDASLHALEVHTADAPEPLQLLAEPVGAATPQGWPLQLRLREEEAQDVFDIPDLLTPRAPTAPPSSSSLLPSMPPSIAPSSALDDDVFELGSHANMSMVGSMAPSRAEPLHDIEPLLQKLTTTTQRDAFAALASKVAEQVHRLLREGDVASMWRLASTLELIAGDPPGPASRAESAKQALETFRHPQLLAPLAEAAVTGREDRNRIASRLVVRAGKRGARALYQARLKHGRPEDRDRFVALIESIGPPGLPVFTTALAHLESRLAFGGALAIAEDLLRAVPDVQDAALGNLLSLYAKARIPMLALPATHALARIFRDAARPHLREQLRHEDDAVVIAAIHGLRANGGIDRDVLETLEAWIVGTVTVSPAVRLAATEALAYATPDMRGAAHAVAVHTLASIPAASPEVDDLLVALATTIVAMGGDTRVVAERWQRSHPALRMRLEPILRRAAPPR